VTAGIVVSLGVSGNIDVNVLMQGACLVSLDGLLVSLGSRNGLVFVAGVRWLQSDRHLIVPSRMSRFILSMFIVL
jgi:hypothetical protein